MKPFSACRGLIGIADGGLRLVLRELLLGVKMLELEFLADVGGVVHAIRASHQAFDLIIIQNDLPGGGSSAVARCVRWDMSAQFNNLPIISIGRGWTHEMLAEVRDAGICEIIAMPTSLMAVQDKLVSAMDGKRPFLSTAMYRGRCRRRRSGKGYQGPFRRAEDRIAEQLNSAVEKSERRAVRQEQQGGALPLASPAPPPSSGGARASVSPVDNDVEEVGGDRQTRVVIDKAFVTARQIEQLRARIAASGGGKEVAAMHLVVADTEERLINLMALVQMRVEQYGCSPSDIERLRVIRKSVDASAVSLLRTQLSRLIISGEAVLSGHVGLSFNTGVAMQARMSHVDFLINVGGGLENLDSSLRDEVAKAYHIVSQVAQKEAGTMRLRQFDDASSSVRPRA
ncbi:MAG: chemotaxis protein CheY [Alphaproteobacteria bacterium]|nr:chemotaxis protein CheY [Alphaproteobacteria bacterium]